MAEAVRQSVFGQFHLKAHGHERAAITPLPSKERWSLRAGHDGAQRAARVLGLDQAPAMLKAERVGETAMVRLGPDEYWLESDDLSAGEKLRDAVRGSFAAVTELGHRLAAVELKGEASADIINGACPLDLDIETLPAGSSTRTVMGKAEIVLERLDTQHFQLITNRSFAPYLLALLTELAREHRTA